MKLRVAVVVGALSVAGTARVGASPKPGPGGTGECQVHVTYDAEERLLRATYDTPELCWPQDEPLEAWRPRWVLLDPEPDHVDMLVTDEPGAKPTAGNQGWHMRPVAPVGGPYAIQARSGYNNGRATVNVTIGRDGSIVVD